METFLAFLGITAVIVLVIAPDLFGIILVALLNSKPFWFLAFLGGAIYFLVYADEHGWGRKHTNTTARHEPGRLKQNIYQDSERVPLNFEKWTNPAYYEDYYRRKGDSTLVK